MTEIASRRSSRRTKTGAVVDTTAAGTVVVDDVHDSDHHDPKADEESEDEVFEAPKTNKKKRKSPKPKENAKKRAGSQPPPAKKTRTRGTRGVLKQIMEMPFDIVYEIFTLLPPSDLLSIGRTSKDLKDLVLSHDFKAIWSQSFSATGIPPCPEDMSLPAYAELAFGETCWTCGTKKDVQWLWENRKKLCSDCIRSSVRYDSANYSHHPSQLLPSGQLPDALLSGNVLPSFRYGGATYYSNKYAVALFEQYSALNTEEKKSKWVRETVERLSAAITHANKCQTWHKKYLEQLVMDEMAEVRKRKQRVHEIAKEMGWEEEMSNMLVPNSLHLRIEFAKVCEKPFNDRIIENVKALINTIMTGVKADRVARENQDKLRSRMKTLLQAYDKALATQLSPTECRPMACDIFLVPRIKALVTDTETIPDLTVADFKFDRKTLAGVIKDAYDIITPKILHIISNGLGKKGYDPNTVLDLATTLFTNPDLVFEKKSTYQKGQARECSFLTVPEILVCDASRDRMRQGMSILERYAFEEFRCTPWQANSALKFHKAAHVAAGRVLELCELDPATTTLKDLEEIQPVLECCHCNSIQEGRLIMTWDSAVSHILEKYHPGDNTGSIPLSLLEGDDAEKAREALKLQKRRLLYKRENARAVCLHCNAVANLQATTDHLHQKHGVVFAGEEDLEFAYAVKVDFSAIGRPQGEYRMWPPRAYSMR